MFFFALAAYGIWGFAPIYFKAVAFVPALEILTHRILWAFFFLLVLLFASGKIRQVMVALRSPKQLLLLALAAVLIGLNWLLFYLGCGE